MRIIRLTAWLFCLAIVRITHATIIHVPADIDSIQGGINLASDGDTVLVQPGSYVENIDYTGKGIVVGSLLLTTGEPSYIPQTIIDGNQSGSVVRFASGEDSTAILQGFTITNGSAASGGGIYCYNSSSPTLVSLLVSGNSASSWGGGIYCDISSSPRLQAVVVSGNMVTGNGGGICCRHHSNVSLVHVLVTENSASGYGAGLCFRGDSNPTLVNVTVARNSSGSFSGGIYCGNYSFPTLVNAILWNNPPAEIYLEPGSNAAASYSNIQGGWTGDGVINADPLFVDTTSSDYHLQPGSPCIDTGHPDPIYHDQEDPDNPGFALWPAMGTVRNDMGVYGGNADILMSLAIDNGPNDSEMNLPFGFALYQNYPNPFNSASTILYELPQAGDVLLIVYDILGREVARLVDGYMEPGYHEMQWDGRDTSGRQVPSGIYIARLVTPEYSKSIKMVLLK